MRCMAPSCLCPAGLIGLAAVLSATGCSSDEASTDTSSTVPGMSIDVRPSESNPLARYLDIRLDRPGTVQLALQSSSGLVFTRDSLDEAREHTVPVVGLLADELHTITVNASFLTGESGESDLQIQTDTLAFPELDFEVLVPMEEDGTITIFGVDLSHETDLEAKYIGINRAGEVVWANQVDGTARGAHFLEATPDGLWIDYERTGNDDGIRAYQVVNDAGDKVSEYKTPFELFPDGEVLPNGNLVFLYHKKQKVEIPDYGEVDLIGDALAEITTTGEIVWRWDPFDHLDTSRFVAGPGQISEGDWTHSNSVDYLEDTDELIVSLRNQNQVIAIDRSSGEVNRIFGEDGDYTLTEGTWFKGQHHATLEPNGVLTVFDNHYEYNVETTSRVVQYQTDDTTMTMKQIWVHEFDHFYRSAGEATVLPDGGLRISAGGGNREEGAPLQVLELDADRDLLWHVLVPDEHLPVFFQTSQITPNVLLSSAR